MTRIHTLTVDISASAARVWSVLVDVRDYPRWNPFLTITSGRLRHGGRITVVATPADHPPLTLRARVQRVLKPVELVLISQPLVPGFLQGEHRFRIESLAGDLSRLCIHGQFAGALSVVWPDRLENAGRDGFTAMAQALKERTESG